VPNKPIPLAIKAVIPTIASAISFAGGEEEAGVLKLQIYVTGDEIERLLKLRGRELIVVFQGE
jgi:hypothetical protein